MGNLVVLDPKIRSVSALAAAVNRNRATVGAWVRREDWPFGNRDLWREQGGVDVAAVVKWASERLREDYSGSARLLPEAKTAGGLAPAVGDEAVAARKTRQGLDEKKSRLLDLRLWAAEGRLIERSEMERLFALRVAAVKGSLLTLGRSLAPQLAASSDPAECERLVSERHREICEVYAAPLDVAAAKVKL